MSERAAGLSYTVSCTLTLICEVVSASTDTITHIKGTNGVQYSSRIFLLFSSEKSFLKDVLKDDFYTLTIRRIYYLYLIKKKHAYIDL